MMTRVGVTIVDEDEDGYTCDGASAPATGGIPASAADGGSAPATGGIPASGEEGIPSTFPADTPAAKAERGSGGGALPGDGLAEEDAAAVFVDEAFEDIAPMSSMQKIIIAICVIAVLAFVGYLLFSWFIS